MKPTNYPFTEEYSRYLDDRSKRKDAYLNWEVCGSDGIWRAMYGHQQYKPGCLYRKKGEFSVELEKEDETIRLNIPPRRVGAMRVGQRYWCVCLGPKIAVYSTVWNDSKQDLDLLACGRVHNSQSAAVLSAKALSIILSLPFEG